MSRPKLNAEVETRVLTLSKRRCAICFGLDGDLSQKRGQIAHLDHNHENNTLENLVFLCLEHHDQYDGKTSQSKGLQIGEVKAYRTALYDAVRRYLDPRLCGGADQSAPTLLAQGELAFYLTEFRDDLAHSTQVLREIGQVLARYNSQTAERMTKLKALLERPRLNLREAKSLDRLAGAQMTAFGNDLVSASELLVPVSTKMLQALERASAVASDVEIAQREMFEKKLAELQNTRSLLGRTIKSAAASRDQTTTYPRGSSTFNRGKRLVVAAIDEHISQLSRCAEAFRSAEATLQRILTLL